MTTTETTRDKLLAEARRLFWSRGYANVSLRDIAGAAGVDAALVSRYFGSKQGLFDATLADAFDFTDMLTGDPAQLIEFVVQLYVDAPRNTEDPSVVRMMLMNAHDDEIGERVREVVQKKMMSRLANILGDETRAALFVAALLGFAVAEKSLHLSGIAAPGTPEYESQLRSIMQVALESKPR